MERGSHTRWSCEPRHAGPPKTGHSEEFWWKCGVLEEGMANQSTILASRTPWKGKKIWNREDETTGQKVSNMLLGRGRGKLFTSSRKNEATGPKCKWCSVVDVSGDENKVRCCRKQYCIVVQSFSRVWLFAIAWMAAYQASWSFTVSWSLLKHMSVELVIPSNHLAPFSFCPESFPASRSFPVSQHYASGGQSIGASALVLPMNIQGWFPLELTGFISLLSEGFSRVFSSTTVQKHQFFSSQPSLWCNSHLYTWLLEKPITLTSWTFVDKMMSLLFNMLSRFVIAFLPRSNRLLISCRQSQQWFWSPSK